MKKTRKQKGITLIALIITIIVMIILIGVTINIAIQGDLFGTAQSASGQTNLAMDKEILYSAALGFLNNQGKIDVDALVTAYNGKTIEGYTITKDEKYAVATKEDKVLYIDTDGNISEEKKSLGYSFKLPDLEDAYIRTDGDSVSYFNISLLDKNIFGDELFEEGNKYMYNGTPVFYLNSDNNDIVDDLEQNKGNAKYSILVLIENNSFGIQIKSLNENNWNVISQTESTPRDDQMTWSEFVEEYSTVKFTFKDLSGVSFPE